VLHGCHGHSHHRGYHRATWCCSRGYRHHIITGPQKRKLVEKRKKKMYQQADMVRAATKGQTRGPHLHIPQNYLITFYLFMQFWYMNVLKDQLERPTLAYKFHDR
jgi:hypothetical protein